MVINQLNSVDVSVLTANYNNARFLSEYFNSILSSTILPKEIIFVDDGSTDESLKILAEYKPIPWLKVIPLKNNVGFANALNIGIENCKSQYIMRLDPDDFIHPDRIKTQFNFLNNNPLVNILGTNVLYYNNNKKKTIFQSNLPENHEEILSYYVKGHHGLFHTSVMGEKVVFEKIQYKQTEYPAEDYDFFSRVLISGYKVHNMLDPLTFYRIHNRNVYFTNFKDAINKTIELRNTLFGSKTSKLKRFFNSYYKYFYRKFLLSNNLLSRTYNLLLASLLNPMAVGKRIF